MEKKTPTQPLFINASTISIYWFSFHFCRRLSSQMSSPGGDNDESEADDDLDVVSNPANETGSASDDLRLADSPHSNNGKLHIMLVNDLQYSQRTYKVARMKKDL